MCPVHLLTPYEPDAQVNTPVVGAGLQCHDAPEVSCILIYAPVPEISKASAGLAVPIPTLLKKYGYAKVPPL